MKMQSQKMKLTDIVREIVTIEKILPSIEIGYSLDPCYSRNPHEYEQRLNDLYEEVQRRDICEK